MKKIMRGLIEALVILSGVFLFVFYYHGLRIQHSPIDFSLSDAAKKQFNKHVGKSPVQSVVHQQFNFHVVAPGIWRSSQPNAESISRMKEHGLKTIINLRKNKAANQWGKEQAARMGIQHYNFPMSADVRQDDKKLTRILNIMSDPENQPVLVHCFAGKDRTGLVAGLYKINILGHKYEDVYKEMLMYGFNIGVDPILQTLKEYRYINKL